MFGTGRQGNREKKWENRERMPGTAEGDKNRAQRENDGNWRESEGRGKPWNQSEGSGKARRKVQERLRQKRGEERFCLERNRVVPLEVAGPL
ncbi:MAG: hypothetical protein IJ241_05360 [Clostridia bacterium]|nr:hypothetical protein [Clostridia bacterium]